LHTINSDKSKTSSPSGQKSASYFSVEKVCNLFKKSAKLILRFVSLFRLNRAETNRIESNRGAKNAKEKNTTLYSDRSYRFLFFRCRLSNPHQRQRIEFEDSREKN
jgi:hypothetical protein